MVPISGRPSTPESRRVPATPNCGPGYFAANASGSVMSSSRSPLKGRSSNRLPATVATRLGSDAPKLSSGHDSTTSARRHTGLPEAPFGTPAPGSEGSATSSSSVMRSI